MSLAAQPSKPAVSTQDGGDWFNAMMSSMFLVDPFLPIIILALLVVGKTDSTKETFESEIWCSNVLSLT